MLNILDLEFEEMEEITEENQEEQKEKFKVKDLGQANWAFRKLSAIARKKKEIEQLAKAELDRIKEWEKKEKESLESSESFFNYLLEEYYREERELDKDFKLTTPYGKVTSRKQQPKYTYKDELIIGSLKARGLAKLYEEKTVVSVNKNDLKKEIEILENVVSLNGEIKANMVYQDPLFIDTETGEIDHEKDYLHHDRVITIDGQVIHGVEVEERDPKITIKVEG